ncbi:hypothetical protein ACIPSA_26940 [Streptomyces sp. NPDC086549]|uniref:hypothetical protein n=1 Tax=Streptomyces sp. NPDC086549 TaxID=3365752 RepID=UPI0037F7B384
MAAAGRPLVGFSLRRTHGPWTGLQSARPGALVGFPATSNVAAAAALDIPAAGTMAHSYVEAFPGEEEAFRAFARTRPGPVTFLVDAHDTDGGCGRRPASSRRSGAGPGARSVWTAAISGSCRGGRVPRSTPPGRPTCGSSPVAGSTSTPSPVWCGAGHRSTCTRWVPAAPGRKQVLRRSGRTDVIGLWEEDPADSARPLLRTVMRGGRRTVPADRWEDARARFTGDIGGLPTAARRIDDPEPLRPVRSKALEDLTSKVRAELASRYLRGAPHHALGRWGEARGSPLDQQPWKVPR